MEDDGACGLTIDELRALLADPACPFAPDTRDIVTAIRECRQPRRGRIITARDLAQFIHEKTTEQPTPGELAALMEALGATRTPVIDLEGLAGRTLRRLAGGRRMPRRFAYEMPGAARPVSATRQRDE